MTSIEPATLVLDEVLDAASSKAMLRFQRRAKLRLNKDAAIDLRRTRSVASGPWATLVKGVNDLTRAGWHVTIIARKRLNGLLQLSSFAHQARVVIVA